MGGGGVERHLALLSAASGDYSVNKTERINSMVTAAAGKPSWSVSEVLWWAEVLPRPEEAPKARPGASVIPDGGGWLRGGLKDAFWASPRPLALLRMVLSISGFKRGISLDPRCGAPLRKSWGNLPEDPTAVPSELLSP